MADRTLLTVNGGSSSLKVAVYRMEPALARVLDGSLERLGQADSTFTTHRPGKPIETRTLDTTDRSAVMAEILSWLEAQPEGAALAGAGHRIVHGGDRYLAPCLITEEVSAHLRTLCSLDPTHLPFELDLIEAVTRARGTLPQIACFDTAFHGSLPEVARMLPLPRRLFDAGIRRYGFHGLAFSSVVAQIEQAAGPKAAHGRLVLAHLGSGASLAAVKDGQSIDTTMALTPASGVPMGTRSGDLDPGIFPYLARTQGMTSDRFAQMVNHESGLLGVSGRSADVRDLLGRADNDPNAALALDLFGYEVKKRIGAFAAALGGLDGLAFSGGIGEHASALRARICEGLAFIGIEIDPDRNRADAPVISRPGAPISVWIVRADEERVIAQAVARLLSLEA